MKIKISEATLLQIDWAVSVCEHNVGWQPEGQDRDYYSTNWAQGGPIIEREKLCVGTRYTSDQIYWDADVLCWARTPIGGYLKYGPTPLIAAMRCYVASKLGDEIEVPDELTKGEQQ